MIDKVAVTPVGKDRGQLIVDGKPIPTSAVMVLSDKPVEIDMRQAMATYTAYRKFLQQQRERVGSSVGRAKD